MPPIRVTLKEQEIIPQRSITISADLILLMTVSDQAVLNEQYHYDWDSELEQLVKKVRQYEPTHKIGFRSV